MIDKLKIEIFELIRQQDILRIQYSNIEKQKQLKLQELTKLEQANAKLGSGENGKNQ